MVKEREREKNRTHNKNIANKDSEKACVSHTKASYYWRYFIMTKQNEKKREIV